MATIDEILQLPMSNAVNWPGDLHIGYFTDQKEYVDNTFDPETPAPALLQPYITEFATALEGENTAYRVPSKSDFTERIAKADEERDVLLSQVRTMIEAFEKLAAMPAKQQAAQLMRSLWDVYKPDPSMAYERETTAIVQWYEDFSASTAQVDAAEELGLTSVIAALVAKNRKHSTIYR